MQWGKIKFIAPNKE